MNYFSKKQSIRLDEASFQIKKSSIPEAGNGLFAKVAIAKGEHIGYYEGKVLNDEEVDLDAYCQSLYLLWICKDHWIFGEGEYGNYTQFINHSNRPNVELVTSTRWKTARFRTLRPIQANEELFFDYGDYYWEQVGYAPSEFFCETQPLLL